MTTTDQLKEFLDIARARLKECGEKEDEPYKDNTRCAGCPAYGKYGTEFDDCVFRAALDVGKGY